jgi:hypothetical protein
VDAGDDGFMSSAKPISFITPAIAADQARHCIDDLDKIRD